MLRQEPATRATAPKSNPEFHLAPSFQRSFRSPTLTLRLAFPATPPPPRPYLKKGVVRKVEPGSLTLTDGTVIPFGLCIWSTGVGPTPFTLSLPFAKTQVGGAPRGWGDEVGPLVPHTSSPGLCVCVYCSKGAGVWGEFGWGL